MFVVLLLEIKVKHKSSQKDIIRTRITLNHKVSAFESIAMFTKKKKWRIRNTNTLKKRNILTIRGNKDCCSAEKKGRNISLKR